MLEESLCVAKPQLAQLSTDHLALLTAKEEELQHTELEMNELRHALVEVRGMIEVSSTEWRCCSS